jgi:antitoxin component YwqK of YwqJK toxin-antitoxin module
MNPRTLKHHHGFNKPFSSLSLNQLLGFLFATSFLFSCSNDLKQEVVSTFPDGNPMKVEYVRYSGDQRIVEKEVRFYPNGEKEEEGGFLNGKRNGHWTYWYDNGNVWSEGDFKEGVREGKGIVNYKNGKTNFIGYYKQGRADSLWTFFDGDEKKTKEVWFEMGKKVKELEY